MGICLDTEHSDGSQAFEEGTESWVQNSPRPQSRNAVTPSAGKFPMHNNAQVLFEAPKAPVIFVLGGPGSGKVTHCDNLVQEKKEVVHINMSDLLQQYAIGNDGYTSLINIGNRYQDIPDYAQLSSRTVTEVLMVEMKMAPNAKTYLVSGYPRNMRDVVEYSDKIRIVNGVILISWRQKVLERQIDYGAKLGQVVLSLAKMELNNFYKNVIPVAEYFAQSKMLIRIHGERPPADVYKDFKAAFFQILSSQDNPPEFSNGALRMMPTNTTSELPTIQNNVANGQAGQPSQNRPGTQVISVGNHAPLNFNSPVKPPTYPPVLWVIGGPGSNKAALCAEATRNTGWTHISLGKLLRAAAETSESEQPDIPAIRDCITNGELVPFGIVMRFVNIQMEHNIEAQGIILDGFPRDIDQAYEFEAMYKQKPTIILLDCSKLQLGKGRLDDSVTAFRRRLEIFRESTLPMLKTMDNIGRLTIVDGDTDTAPVQDDFKGVVQQHIEYMLNSLQEPQTTIPDPQLNGHVPTANGHISNGHVPNGHIPNGETTLEDLEGAPEVVTISKHVGNGVSHVGNNVANHVANGIRPGNENLKIPQGVKRNVPTFASLDDGHGHEAINYMDSHI
ncbi:adenylate kinase isoenzyme 5 isoform X1 [Euwallacea fornicatus]|uniref:adenylate kinase isoenzyme 5 isoform X1 n=1 Tax=Euwallacea fornicatus TaxID=995702 RepID=UPI003390161F